jgi:hypothetical protein
LGEIHGRVHVEFEHEIAIFESRLAWKFHPRTGSIVDEDINGPERLLGAGEKSAACSGIREVRGDCSCTAPMCFNLGHRVFESALQFSVAAQSGSGQNHSRSLCRKTPGNGPADSAARAGDECDFPAATGHGWLPPGNWV